MSFDLTLLGTFILQFLFVFLLSPLIIGIMRKVKALLQGRSGSPIYQVYIDVFKLLMKGTVKSKVTSWIFVLAPIFLFASVAAAASVMPIFSTSAPLAADLILFVYLFAIGRFFTALSGLDAGSSFGGLGSSREMLMSGLIEPALFTIVIFIVVIAGSSNLTALAASAPGAWPGILLSPAYWLAAVALFVLILAETGRLPFDNPATHLELTMIHEAMILENSGPNLALIEWSHASKIFLLFALFANIFLPIQYFSTNIIVRGAAIFVSCVILGIITATLESTAVKVRIFKVAELLVLAFVFALLSLLISVFGSSVEGVLPMLVFVMLACSLYFIFSATFKRRIELYLLQNICLAIIFFLVAYATGATDAYLRFGVTLVLKVFILPLLLYKAFTTMAKGEKILALDQLTAKNVERTLRTTPSKLRGMIDFDPLFLDAPIQTTTTLTVAAILMAVLFVVTSGIGSGILLPLVLSLVIVALLIIAVKTHALLEVLGFLMLENGIVLLPVALGVNIPIISEVTTIFDTVILIVVAVVLILKVQQVTQTLDTGRLNELIEKR